MDCLLLNPLGLSLFQRGQPALHEAWRVVEMRLAAIVGCNAVATAAAVAFIENVLLSIPSSSSI